MLYNTTVFVVVTSIFVVAAVGFTFGVPLGRCRNLSGRSDIL